MRHRLLFVGGSRTTSTRQCRWQQAVAILGHDPFHPRAAEVSGVLRDFLSTGFGPSNPALSDVVKDFLDDSDNLLKGPYLSVDLPFQRAPGGRRAVPGYPARVSRRIRHQRTAFERLTGWPVHRHRDRNRFRQDRVLPLSGARPLPHAGLARPVSRPSSSIP